MSAAEPAAPALTPFGRLVAEHRRSLGSGADERLSTDDIVQLLQQAIIRGVFAPGRALRQDDLALELGVSKIPVREALRTLEAYGFVELPHNRGAVVKELTLAQLREAFDLRQMVEPLLMRAAVARLSEAALKEAAELVERMAQERNAWTFSRLNSRFHQILYEAADMPLSMQILTMLQGYIQRMSFMQLSMMGFNRSSNEDHRHILDACRRGDADAAARHVADHVSGIKTVVMGLYAQLHGDTGADELHSKPPRHAN
ncbi:GntR family transcriptional regulator [Parazoarcus communis]|nr:GntR family transcriptional regulator [Parazoarcus communis]